MLASPCSIALGLLATCPLAAQQFDEVAASAGIDFRHAASKTAAKYLPETMGAGVALFDYDGDGRLDLYFVNGARLETSLSAGEEPSKSDPRFWNRLYRNLGEWRFEDVTAEAGVAGRGFGMGAAVGDYDNDGDPDLFISNVGRDIQFRNNGDGTFTDVTAESGISGEGWSAGAAFFDYDRDGLLDLFVAQYLDWSFDSNPPCGPFLPDRRSYCHPRRFAAVPHRLYRNLGGGRFGDVSKETGIAARPGKGLGMALGDFDDDHWIDVFVANDSYPQQLFRNISGKRFEEVAVPSGVAYDPDGRDYAGMGAAWEDYDRDGLADIFVNALGRQGYWLYRNDGGEFEAVSTETGLAAPSALRSGWGTGLVDFDNDGWRDLFVAQGHVMDDIAGSDTALAYREPLMLLRNLFGRFFDVAHRAGQVFNYAYPARGAAFGDLDGDGRVDIVVNVNDGPALLLRNVTEQAGKTFAVSMEGVKSNRDAIGAKLIVSTARGVRQTAWVSRAGSYLSSNTAAVHVGLGEDDSVESVEILWPSGRTQTIDRPDSPFLRVIESAR